MNKMNGVRVYTATIPEKCNITDVLPEERNAEIKSTNNKKVKAEKFYAWKLLEYAVFDAFGFIIDELNFAKTVSGKWVCDKFYFSISHSNNLVAVSLSKTPVGIDVEKFEKPKKDITRIFSASERIEFDKLIDEQKWQYLITSWVMKESVYKMKGEGAFLPSKIDTSNVNTVIEKMNLNNETYIFSIASEKNEIVQYFNNVKI